jgi:hypothetical protein
MKTLVSVLFLVVLVLSTSTALRADVADPKNPRKTNRLLNTTLEIVPDAKTSIARLQIKRSSLSQLRAALDETETNQSVAAGIINSAPRTIIAGLLIFLSLATGGIFLVRSIRTTGVTRGHKTAAVILVAVTTLGAAAIISRANVGPPPALRWWDAPSALANGEAVSGNVIVEIVPDDQNTNAIKLIIPYKKRPTGDE